MLGWGDGGEPTVGGERDRRAAARLVVSALAASVLVVAAGCSTSSSPSSAATPSTAPASRATSTTRPGSPTRGASSPSTGATSGPSTTASPSPAAKALGDLLPTKAPSGLALQPDRVGGTGPSGLAKAVQDDGQPDAEAVITRDGFVAGYQRLWASSDGQTQNILFLYRFRGASGASDYLARTLAQSTSVSSGPAPTGFSVGGIPGAHGLQLAQGTEAAAVVLFARGGYLVQAVVADLSGGSPSQVRASVVALAHLQYDRLPAS